MYCISLNLSSDEWVRIYKSAREQWPGELLSRSEILRRYIVIGVAKLKNVSPQDAKRMAFDLQKSMTVPDTRLSSWPSPKSKPNQFES